MAWTPEDQLRGLLGETIPTGGTDADTYFTDVQIANMLLESQGSITRAAYAGWQMKAAYYADLVNVTEGNSVRQMSDLQNHALAMVKMYAGESSDLTAGRTRVGRVRRRWF